MENKQKIAIVKYLNLNRKDELYNLIPSRMRPEFIKNVLKKDLVNILVDCWKDQASFNQFFHEVDSDIHAIIKFMIWKDYCDIDTFLEFFPGAIEEHRWNKQINERYFFLEYEYFSHKVTISQKFANIIRPYFPAPKGWYINETSLTDDDEVLNCEDDFIALLSTLKYFFSKISDKYSSSMSDFIKITSSSAFAQISFNPINSKNKFQADFISNVFARIVWNSWRNSSLVDFIECIYNDCLRPRNTGLFLFQVFSITRSKNYYTQDLYNEFCLVVREFAERDSDTWIDLDSLLENAVLKDKFPVTKIIEYNNKLGVKEQDFVHALKNGDEELSSSIYTKVMINRIFWILNFIGMVEIVLDKDCDNQHPIFKKISKVKLTSLAYKIINETGDIKIDSKKRLPKKKKLHFDDDKTIISNVYDLEYLFFIEGIGEKITDSVFKITKKSIVKNLENNTELTTIIERLKKLSKNTLSQTWLDFFAEINNDFDLVYDVTQEYKVYNLKKFDHELVYLITHDKILKELCIKAENRLILVPYKRRVKFTNRVKELGYFIN
jgi:hypothetical protein